MRRWAVLLLCGAMLAACRQEDPPPDATATSAPTVVTTTAAPATTTTVDVAAAPTTAQLQVPAYWNAVLATLNHIVGDALRSAASTRKVDQAAVDRLREVYGPTAFDDEYKVLVEVAAGNANGLVIPPGDAVANVTGIVKADSRCVALKATLDYAKVNPTVPTSEVVMKLLPRQRLDNRGLNRTPWAIEEFFVIAPPEDGSRLCSD